MDNNIEYSENISQKNVKTNIGDIPVEDYREILAVQNGFDSYESMRKEGYVIDGVSEEAARDIDQHGEEYGDDGLQAFPQKNAFKPDYICTLTIFDRESGEKLKTNNLEVVCGAISNDDVEIINGLYEKYPESAYELKSVNDTGTLIATDDVVPGLGDKIYEIVNEYDNKLREDRSNIEKAMKLRGYEKIDLDDGKITFIRPDDTQRWVFKYDNWEQVRESLLEPVLWEDKELTRQINELIDNQDINEKNKDKNQVMSKNSSFLGRKAELLAKKFKDSYEKKSLSREKTEPKRTDRD